MPQRFELTELSAGILSGPVAIAYARGGRVIGYAATVDADGLQEGPEECLAAAKQWRRRHRLDNVGEQAEDSG